MLGEDGVGTMLSRHAESCLSCGTMLALLMTFAKGPVRMQLTCLGHSSGEICQFHWVTKCMHRKYIQLDDAYRHCN